MLSSNSDVLRSSGVGASVVLAEAMDDNAKITELCEVGNLRNAVELLRRSQKSELELNTYFSVLQLCAEHKALQEGRMIHSIILPMA